MEGGLSCHGQLLSQPADQSRSWKVRKVSALDPHLVTCTLDPPPQLLAETAPTLAQSKPPPAAKTNFPTTISTSVAPSSTVLNTST